MGILTLAEFVSAGVVVDEDCELAGDDEGFFGYFEHEVLLQDFGGGGEDGGCCDCVDEEVVHEPDLLA